MKQVSQFKYLPVAFLALALLSAFPLPSEAVPIAGTLGSGTDGIGSFTGDFTYTQGTSRLAVMLTNTSPVSNGGFLTAFAFNNPSNLITGVTLASTLPTFNTLLGGPGFNNGVAASPFGNFDIGAATGSSWLGSGSPLGGIAVGTSATFTFTLTCGTGLCGTGLSTGAFLSALSASPGGGGAQFFVARFRGFLDGGSDKVPAVVVPEPTSLLLLGSGLAALGLWRRRGRGK